MITTIYLAASTLAFAILFVWWKLLDPLNAALKISFFILTIYGSAMVLKALGYIIAT